MKKTVIICILWSAVLPFISTAQIVAIPDSYFKNALLNHNPPIDTNIDGEIQLSEAEAFTGTIDINATSGDPGQISDLTGIQAFINIEELLCGYHKISQIDLSANGKLRYLSASGNPLDHIDFSHNYNLQAFQCNNCLLTELHLESNVNFRNLFLQDNPIAFIDLRNNLLLSSIIISNSPVEQLLLPESIYMYYLYARDTKLTNLDVSGFPNLVSLDCRDNINLEYINLKSGNNENLNISGGGQSCNFTNLPVLETVCLDAIDSPLADFILAQVGHSLTFTEECLLPTHDFDENEASVFPNPAKDILYLQSKNVMTHIEVYNILGISIYEAFIYDSNTHLNVQNYPKDLYLIHLKDVLGNGTVVKFIKK
jgi:Secretion system C-terminal sorting domain